MSSGIDYGNGITNIDVKTGIRYGVISVLDVLQAWADESEPFYPCANCEHFNIEDGDECANDFCEPSSWYYEDDELQAETCFDGTEIMVFKSLYYTHGRFCSPCAPGAVDLNAIDPDGEKAYCFGHIWFEDNKAPYPVFLVATGEEVLPG